MERVPWGPRWRQRWKTENSSFSVRSMEGCCPTSPTDPPGPPPLTGLIMRSSLGTPLFARMSWGSFEKPFPGNGKGDFNRGVGLLCHDNCVLFGVLSFFKSQHTENPKKVPPPDPGCDRQKHRFFLVYQTGGVGRERTNERKGRKENADPTALLSATWVCTIKSQ